MTFGYRSGVFPLHRLRDEIDRVLTGFVDQLPEWVQPAAPRGQPAVNVWETSEAVMVESEVPGVGSSQLDISVAGNELTLKVQRPEVSEEGMTYHRRERPIGSFTRVVRLPAEVDAERVQAELRDGVLTITLPKAASARPRKVEVTIGK